MLLSQVLLHLGKCIFSFFLMVKLGLLQKRLQMFILRFLGNNYQDESLEFMCDAEVREP